MRQTGGLPVSVCVQDASGGPPNAYYQAVGKVIGGRGSGRNRHDCVREILCLCPKNPQLKQNDSDANKRNDDDDNDEVTDV